MPTNINFSNLSFQPSSPNLVVSWQPVRLSLGHRLQYNWVAAVCSVFLSDFLSSCCCECLCTCFVLVPSSPFCTPEGFLLDNLWLPTLANCTKSLPNQKQSVRQPQAAWLGSQQYKTVCSCVLRVCFSFQPC